MNFQLQLRMDPSESPATLASDRVRRVAAMFGLDLDAPRPAIIAPIELTLRDSQIVFVTGSSGGGKSTMLRRVRDQLTTRCDARVIDFAPSEPRCVSERST